MTGGRVGGGRRRGAAPGRISTGARARPPLLRYDIIFRWPSEREQIRHNIDTIKSSELNSPDIDGLCTLIQPVEEDGERRGTSCVGYPEAVLITHLWF